MTRDFEPRRDIEAEAAHLMQLRDSTVRGFPVIVPEAEAVRISEMFPILDELHGGFIEENIEDAVNGIGLWKPSRPYTREEFSLGQWDTEDVRRGAESVRAQEYSGYFINARNKLSAAPDFESRIRRTQEQAIVADLNNGKPVLIRGLWGIGKTTMLNCVTRSFEGKAIRIHFASDSRKKLDLQSFEREFGSLEVAGFIADKEDPNSPFDETLRTQQEIRRSGIPALDYLDQYLERQQEVALLGVDEPTRLTRELEYLKKIADLKRLKNVKVVALLHPVVGKEDSIADIFEGWSEHTIKSIGSDEMRDWVEWIFEGIEVQFTDAAMDEIMEFSGGRPIYAKLLISELMHRAASVQIKLLYKANDIRKISPKVIDYIANHSGHLADPINIYWTASNNQGRDIIDAILNSGAQDKESFDPEQIQTLVDADIIWINPQTGHYSIRGRVLDRLLRYASANRDYMREDIRQAMNDNTIF